ncbi:hypothetical protein OH809_03260 [Streptomyces sp. NBC_00873]|uniref:hypothetical protein n=1 Tax=unclassified Streptomyces TaxID=2593676 RepID=UPI00386D78BC|nr:hypothetical protein OH809_03260 [Streptomyces sp. NBC_00873]WTA48098.1 hypothetical protein OH821_40535 [Streptomyces sp. NBC_00842]
MTNNAYDPARGWRLDRIPGRRIRRIENPYETAPAALELPLWIVRDGEHHGDGRLRMSLAEAEQLHAELCLALANEATAGKPACR